MLADGLVSLRRCTYRRARNGRPIALVGTLVLMVPSFGDLAEAQPAEPVSLMERAPCRSWAEPNWTAAELWVWRQSCDGLLADLRAFSEEERGAGSAPREAADAPEDRTLRASFLETILLNAPYRDALKPRGLHVHGAVVTGRLDLSNARLDFPLYLEHSRFDNPVTLRDLRSSSFVEFGHSRFDAFVDMQRVRIDNGLLSMDAEFEGLTLHGAEIEGQLALNGASFRSRLNLGSIRVARDVLMRGTSVEALNLVGARIEGALMMNDAKASGRVNADSLILDQSLFLKEAQLGELNLSTARIEGKISGRGLEVKGNLEADGIVTTGWVDLSSVSATSLDLNSSSIGGYLSLSDTRVSGAVNASAASVDLSSSRIEGNFSLSDAQVSGPLSASAASINLDSSRVEGSLSLSGATVTNALNLNSLRTASSAFLRSVVLDSVDLDLAQIGGQANFWKAGIEGDLELESTMIARDLIFGNGSRIGGRIDLERATIRGNFVLQGHEQVGDLDFLGTEVGGQIFIKGSRFQKGLDLDSTTVGDSLFLRGGGPPLTELLLRGVEIGGLLQIKNQHIVKRLDLHETHIADSLYLWNVVGPDLAQSESRCKTEQDGGREHETSIRDTEIGGDFDLSGSRLSCLDLSGSKVGDSFQLYSGDRGAVQWHGASTLMLRDVQVGTLVDDSTLENWPRHLDLAGFRFTRFTRLPGGADVEAGDRGTGWYRRWLARSVYSAQAYQRLADYLRRNGRIEDANDILFAGRERYRTEHASPLEWVGLTLLKTIIGYGYGHKIFYSLIWVLVFVVIGAAVVWANGEGRRRGVPWTVVYSLDHLLPIVRLDERNYKLHLHGAAQYYIYFHTLVGYILASFVVAGLAGLTN